MTLLDRYLGRALLGALARILVSLVALVLLVDLLTHRQDNILRYEVPAGVVARYYLAFIPTVLVEFQAVAMSVLLAALMVLGRSAQDNEVTAALAGGIGLGRIARMPILLALLTALALFAFQETWGVRATAVAKQIEGEYFSRFTPDARAGASWANLPDPAAPQRLWTCHVAKFNRAANTGEEVYLYALGVETLRVIEADRIFWEPERGTWLLEDGLSAVFYPARGMESTVVRISQAAAPFEEPPERLFALEQPPETKTARTFAKDLDRAAAMGIPVGRHLVEYHAKFARPALCFVMIWLAIPFALRVRRGGLAIGFGVSIVIALIYLLMFYVSMGMGRWEMLPPVLAAWLPNVVFLAVGAWLFRQTPT
jgi:lipopolysaccharide export system permease protein